MLGKAVGKTKAEPFWKVYVSAEPVHAKSLRTKCWGGYIRPKNIVLESYNGGILQQLVVPEILTREISYSK